MDAGSASSLVVVGNPSVFVSPFEAQRAWRYGSVTRFGNMSGSSDEEDLLTLYIL